MCTIGTLAGRSRLWRTMRRRARAGRHGITHSHLLALPELPAHPLSFPQGHAFSGGTWILSGIDASCAPFYTSALFIKTLGGALGESAKALSARAAAWRASQRDALLRHVEATGARPPADEGRVHVENAHLAEPRGGRYFVLGANYYRSAFSNNRDIELVRTDLLTAAAAGLNTVRVYGNEEAPDAAVTSAFREVRARRGVSALCM